MDLKFFKEHPYGATAGAVVLFGLVYYLARNKTAATPGASGATSNGPDLQLLQLQSANQNQANQLQAQTEVAGIAASVQNNQTAAQLQATDTATAASLAALQLQTQAAVAQQTSNNQTQVQLTQIQADASTAQQAASITGAFDLQKLNADVLTTQLQTGADVQKTQMNDILAGQQSRDATQLDAIKTQYDYQTGIAALQVAAAEHGMDTYDALATTVAASAGKKYNTAGDANRATALLSQILAGGNPSPVLNQQTTGAAVSIANSPASIINSIGNVAAPIITGLFA